MICPDCGSSKVKLNGHIHNGKQNHLCKDCGRQFVLDPTQKRVSDSEKETINKLLLERISLAGICRVVGVSEAWLQDYIGDLYAETPEDLGAFIPEASTFSEHLAEKFDTYIAHQIEKKDVVVSQDLGDIGEFEQHLADNFMEMSPLTCPLMKGLYEKKEGILYQVYRCEADEMWSFVGSKENKAWIWLVMNTANRQIIAYHVGGRGQADAKLLFEKVPQVFKDNTVFFTDFWNGYHILEDSMHVAAGKEKGYTNHIERFNNTLRQRCSRLVRLALSFSKKLENHIGAIKYFIFHYNIKLALQI